MPVMKWGFDPTDDDPEDDDSGEPSEDIVFGWADRCVMDIPLVIWLVGLAFCTVGWAFIVYGMSR